MPWQGPIIDFANQLQDTTIDAIVAGHTHRVSNLMVGRILVTEGVNAGATYSVLQLMVSDSDKDVEWAGGATRVAKNLGVAKRPDVQAIIDAANAETAVLRNQVIGTQQFDIKRDPTRLHESAMGNLVADAMRLKYPGVDAALTNSGGLRADINCAPPSASEATCEVTWGEMFAVLPFGNRTVIETVTGEQLTNAFINGFTPFCFVGFPGGTGRFPQISGLKVQFHCNGQTPVVDGIWKAPNGPGGTLTPVGAADTVRLVTNDFMYTGSDGYTALTGGPTCCSQAMPCSTSPSSMWPSTRRSARWSMDVSSARSDNRWRGQQKRCSRRFGSRKSNRALEEDELSFFDMLGKARLSRPHTRN